MKMAMELSHVGYLLFKFNSEKYIERDYNSSKPAEAGQALFSSSFNFSFQLWNGFFGVGKSKYKENNMIGHVQSRNAGQRLDL